MGFLIYAITSGLNVQVGLLYPKIVVIKNVIHAFAPKGQK